MDGPQMTDNMQIPSYPTTPTVDQVDSYHGISVADPYRWLEASDSADCAAWIDAQKAVTEHYLRSLPERGTLRRRFEQLLGYPRYYSFVRGGPYLLYLRNEGLQRQLVLCCQHGLSGTPEVLVDPLDFAPDGTAKLEAIALSRDAQYLAYGISQGGSDWQVIRVKDMTTRTDLEERLQWVKISTVAWQGHGFYYSRFPAPARVESKLSESSQHHQVWYHWVGTLQASDTLVYEDPDHPRRLHFVQTTNDEALVVLVAVDCDGDQSSTALWLLNGPPGQGELTPLIPSFVGEFRLVDGGMSGILLMTDYQAPNWRLVLIDPMSPSPEQWREVIAEREHVLEQVAAAGGKLFATYRQDATHRLYVADSAGRFEAELPLPELGRVWVFPGQSSDKEALWSFASFTTPTTIYRYDIDTRTNTALLTPTLTFSSADYQTDQVWYHAKDGTQIPMFLVHRKDLTRNGRNRLLLYGYGGNGNSVGPAFDPLLIALLERGVIFAVPCLRGGGEYGQVWHRAGSREKKQTVFDDCISAIEWLHRSDYTAPDRTALFGASNGGLLVGAVMIQRPDLCAVALPCSGVMDMLRFQHFTIGHLWGSEYGTSDDPTMFPFLLAYSPVHNIRKGMRYPATLVATSEHDDRVVPAHSFKFIAALQAAGAEPGPYLIRIDTQSGHGAVSLPKELAERADLYSFLLAHTS